MIYIIPQKNISLRDGFDIEDESGQRCYAVVNHFPSIGRRLEIHDANECVLADIRQKLLSFHFEYEIETGTFSTGLIGRFSVSPHFELSAPGWAISGRFIEQDFIVTHASRRIAAVTRKDGAPGERIVIDVADPRYTHLAIALAIIAQCVYTDRTNATGSVWNDANAKAEKQEAASNERNYD